MDKLSIAVEDTKLMEESEVSHNLTVLSKGKIKMAFIKRSSSKQFFKFNKDASYIWPQECLNKSAFDLTIPSYGYIFCFAYSDFDKIYKKTKENNLKLTQMLGLLPVWSNYGKDPYNNLYVVEVDSKDIFRPCKDNEVYDNTCDIVFKEGKYTEEYKIWFENWKKKSEEKKIPFTGLGYTYDWSNPETPEEIGVSEFVIKPGSHIKLLEYRII